jgi:hypothetical protein
MAEGIELIRVVNDTLDLGHDIVLLEVVSADQDLTHCILRLSEKNSISIEKAFFSLGRISQSSSDRSQLIRLGFHDAHASAPISWRRPDRPRSPSLESKPVKAGSECTAAPSRSWPAATMGAQAKDVPWY